MGAVEHLRTLCCLGLTPESAMVAATPLLHDVIPHGWSRWALLEPDGTISGGYSENPATSAVLRERMWSFVEDPSSPLSLWMPCFRAVGIGWTLHMQGRGWFENRWYREIEAPLDSCWVLDAMIGEAGRTYAIVSVTRPHGTQPFTSNDVERLDRLRPWLAHAFRRTPGDNKPSPELESTATVGAPVASGEMVLAPDGKILFQTCGLEYLLRRVLEGERGNHTRHVPHHDRLPSPVQKLIGRLLGSANGTSIMPPRMNVATAYGIVTLEAKWLVPAGGLPCDVAKDPAGCHIAVTIELREHAIAYAARILRDHGATPAQIKVGIQLAMGKTKPVIAEELGLKVTTVGDLTKKLYQNLDVHNATELGTKIWLREDRDKIRGVEPTGALNARGKHPLASLFRT